MRSSRWARRVRCPCSKRSSPHAQSARRTPASRFASTARPSSSCRCGRGCWRRSPRTSSTTRSATQARARRSRSAAATKVAPSSSRGRTPGTACRTKTCRASSSASSAPTAHAPRTAPGSAWPSSSTSSRRQAARRRREPSAGGGLEIRCVFPVAPVTSPLPEVHHRAAPRALGDGETPARWGGWLKPPCSRALCCSRRLRRWRWRSDDPRGRLQHRRAVHDPRRRELQGAERRRRGDGRHRRHRRRLRPLLRRRDRSLERLAADRRGRGSRCARTRASSTSSCRSRTTRSPWSSTRERLGDVPHRRAAEVDLGTRLDGRQLAGRRPELPRRAASASTGRGPTPARSTTSRT